MPLKQHPLGRSRQFRNALMAGVLLMGLLAALPILAQPIMRNQAFSQALRSVLQQTADYRQVIRKLEPVLPIDCRINWQISLLSLRLDTPPDMESNLNRMLACSPASVDWLFLITPQRADLALRAAELYPEQKRAWFWLGELASKAGDPTRAIQYYTESIRLDPAFGLAWCRLGKTTEQQGLLEDALTAFWQCCQNGDPGSHGCFGAGRMAEKLGDIPSAIRYYRRSHFATALERADELEASR